MSEDVFQCGSKVNASVLSFACYSFFVIILVPLMRVNVISHHSSFSSQASRASSFYCCPSYPDPSSSLALLCVFLRFPLFSFLLLSFLFYNRTIYNGSLTSFIFVIIYSDSKPCLFGVFEVELRESLFKNSPGNPPAMRMGLAVIFR